MAFAEATPLESDHAFGYCVIEAVDGLPTVWLRGEHDSATAIELVRTLAIVSRDSVGDVVVDLSKVQFMSAATIRVLEQARMLLAEQSRMLVVRNPSSSARRLLDLCSITYLNARH